MSTQHVQNKFYDLPTMEDPVSILFSTNSLTAVANVNTTCPEQILWTDPLSIAFIDPASIGALQSKQNIMY